MRIFSHGPHDCSGCVGSNILSFFSGSCIIIRDLETLTFFIEHFREVNTTTRPFVCLSSSYWLVLSLFVFRNLIACSDPCSMCLTFRSQLFWGRFLLRCTEDNTFLNGFSCLAAHTFSLFESFLRSGPFFRSSTVLAGISSSPSGQSKILCLSWLVLGHSLLAYRMNALRLSLLASRSSGS